MRLHWNKLLIFAMTGMLVLGNVSVASADAVEDADTSYEQFISFGADLKPKEKETVLKEFGVSEADLSNYKTIQVTNKEEHDYLGKYMDASVIGTRALSSVKIVKTKEGSGIHVSTTNIGYCTPSMYCNALVTAGLEDADVKVVGPFKISGTSALVGAMKSYSAMTGENISEKTMDTATDELVTTAEVAKNTGDKEKVAELVAAAKQKVFADNLTKEEDVRNAITSSANALGVNLSDDDVANLTNMMMKISKEDIDVDAIKNQASEIYNKLKDKGIDLTKVNTDGLGEKVGNFFSNIFDAVKDFFTGLFG